MFTVCFFGGRVGVFGWEVCLGLGEVVRGGGGVGSPWVGAMRGGWGVVGEGWFCGRVSGLGGCVVCCVMGDCFDVGGGGEGGCLSPGDLVVVFMWGGRGGCVVGCVIGNRRAQAQHKTKEIRAKSAERGAPSWRPATSTAEKRLEATKRSRESSRDPRPGGRVVTRGRREVPREKRKGGMNR